MATSPTRRSASCESGAIPRLSRRYGSGGSHRRPRSGCRQSECPTVRDMIGRAQPFEWEVGSGLESAHFARIWHLRNDLEDPTDRARVDLEEPRNRCHRVAACECLDDVPVARRPRGRPMKERFQRRTHPPLSLRDLAAGLVAPLAELLQERVAAEHEFRRERRLASRFRGHECAIASDGRGERIRAELSPEDVRIEERRHANHSRPSRDSCSTAKPQAVRTTPARTGLRTT